MFERFDRDDRMLLVFATQEAADLGHRQLGNDHLILGMLCNARSPLFTLLGEQGLTLAGARDVVRDFHAKQDPEEAREAAENAAEESAQQRYDEDREALRSIGIDLDKLRSAVRDRFGEDLSEGWGERDQHRGRGRGRRGGPDGCGPRGHRGHRGHDRRRGESPYGPGGWGPREGVGPRGFGGPAGYGPGAFGPGGPGFGPEGGPFGPGPFGDDGPWEGGRGRRGPRGRGGRPRFASETRDALRAAVEIARERGDRQLRPEYLLIGIIDTADEASQAVIGSVTDADGLKAAVLASLPEIDAAV